MTTKSSWLVHLLDSARGIYIPRDFADFVGWDGISDENLEILMFGPDSDYYWEAWHEVLDNATFNQNGTIFRLWQDGDLWCYRTPKNKKEREEFKDFFGEDYS